MYARFEVVDGPMKGQTFHLEAGSALTFGRGEQADHALRDEPAASRLHFTVRFDPPRARLKDLGSVNGVRVNERKIGGLGADGPLIAELVHGDIVRVGKTVMVFSCPGPDAADGQGDGFDTVQDTHAPAPAADGVPAADVPVPSASATGTGAATGARAVFTDAAPIRPTGSRRAAVDDEADAVPELAGFRQLEKIGRGAGGEIYLARREADDRPVAIKIVRPLTADPERERELFLREIEITCALKHPNVVEFLGAGHWGAAWYLVLEHMAGGDLATRLANTAGPLPTAEAVAIARQIAAGMAAAHQAGIVHRGIHPGNVLFADAAGRVAKIGGLGLAKEIDADASESTLGAVVDGGAWRYMAPEQLTAFIQPLPASDVFSLAATLYEMLTRESVYDSGDGRDLYRAMLEGAVWPLSSRRPDLERSLTAVVDRALSPAPASRHADAGEFLRALPPL